MALTLQEFVILPEDEQRYRIYEALGGTMDLQQFVAPPADEQRFRIYEAAGGSGAGGVTFIETAPANGSDFSMFPGGIAPTTGRYQSWQNNTIWTFDPDVDTLWQLTERSNPA